MKKELEELKLYLLDFLSVYADIDDIGEMFEIQSEINRMIREIEPLSYIWESINADRETLFDAKCESLLIIIKQELDKLN